MQNFYNNHYIKTRADGAIISFWSDGPHPDRDTSGAICINARGGYQFRLALGGAINPPMFSMEGIPLYCWDGQAVRARTEAEIEADRVARPKPPPSELERLRADIDFLAVMGGITL